MYSFDGDLLAQHIFERGKYIDPLKDAILQCIINNENRLSPRYPVRDVNSGILQVFNKNLANQARRYYDFGKFYHDDRIPTNATVEEDDSHDTGEDNYIDPHPDIKPLIEDAVGSEIVILSYKFGLADVSLLIHDYLLQDPENKYIHRRREGLNSANCIDRVSGKYYDISIGLHAYTDLTVTAYEVVYKDGSDSSGDIGWLPDWSNPIELIWDLTTTCNISSTHLVHQVLYHNKTTGKQGVWFYNETTASPILPEYENIHGSVEYIPDNNKGSFPFAMIIEEGRQVIRDEMGEGYRIRTDALLNTLGLSLESIHNALADDSHDPDNPEPGNPDEDIKDALILFAANLDGESQYAMQYAYEHFRQIFYTGNNMSEFESKRDHWKNNTNLPPEQWRWRFAPGKHTVFVNNRFSFLNRFRWMVMHEKTGWATDSLSSRPSEHYLANIVFPTNDPELDADNKGEITIGFDKEPVYGPNFNGVELGKIYQHVFEGNNYATELEDDKQKLVNDDLLIFRKQISAGNDGSNGQAIEQPKYIEMVIMGLCNSVTLTNPNTDITAGGGGQIIQRVNKISEAENGKVFIPISVEVIQQFNMLTQSKVLYDGLMLMMTIYKKEKLPWYADENFMLAIRLVILIISFGTSEAISQGFFEVMKEMAINAALQALISEALVLLIDMVGGEVALVLAAVAAVAAAYSGLGGKGFESLFKLIDAKTLMQASTLIVKAVKEITVENFLELEERIEEFQKEQKEREKELRELESQVLTGVNLDYLNTSRRVELPDFYETPTEFYNRSVHITNPGVFALDALDTYVENNLQLPKYRG